VKRKSQRGHNLSEQSSSCLRRKRASRKKEGQVGVVYGCARTEKDQKRHAAGKKREVTIAAEGNERGKSEKISALSNRKRELRGGG